MVPEEMQAAERSQRNMESPKSSSEKEPISPNFSDGKGNKVRLIGTEKKQEAADLSVYEYPDPNTQSRLEALLKSRERLSNL